jgi:hypothetical protein
MSAKRVAVQLMGWIGCSATNCGSYSIVMWGVLEDCKCVSNSTTTDKACYNANFARAHVNASCDCFNCHDYFLPFANLPP